MPDTPPDYSLSNVKGDRGAEKPELYMVKFFRIKEAEYMKPPLAEQLLEPDGALAPSPSGGVETVTTAACTCNSVCTCVPFSTSACNSVCVCNVVNTSHGTTSSCFGGGGYGGYGGYYAPCF
jgi:hypothetical protein